MLETLYGAALVIAACVIVAGCLRERHHVEAEKRLAQRVAIAREAEETRAYVRARLTLDG